MRMFYKCSALLWFCIALHAQQAPLSTVFEEKPLEKLTSVTFSETMKQALAIAPSKWKHAETENFIIHYRRQTEARKVVREIEYHLWFVAKTLGATKERYSKKSHVVVFEDEPEWQLFLKSQKKVASWAASFAQGDELFLNVRQSGATGRFDSDTLAHETTHAVVSRLYPNQHWPIWLNEGFAEFMAGASIAARKNRHIGRYQGSLESATLPVENLVNISSYPISRAEVDQFYSSSEKFIRFVMEELPKERFTQFVDSILSGKTYDQTLLSLYPEKFKDMDAFRKKYERFR